MSQAATGILEWGTVPSWIALISIVLNVVQYFEMKRAGRRAQADLVSAWIDAKSKTMFLRNGSENPIRNVEVFIVTTAIDFPIPRTDSSQVKTIRQMQLATVPPKNTYMHTSLAVPWESITTDPIVTVIFEDLKGKKWRQNPDGRVTALPSPLRLRLQALWRTHRPFRKKMHHAMFTVGPDSDFDHDKGVWPPYQDQMEDADTVPKTSMNDLADVRVYSPEDGSTLTLPFAPDGVTFEVTQQTVHGLPGMPLFKLGYDADRRLVELVFLNVQDQFSEASLKKLSPGWQAHTLDGHKHALLVLDERFIETDPREFGVVGLESPVMRRTVGHARFLPDFELGGITFNDIDSLFHPAFLAAFGDSARDEGGQSRENATEL